MHKISEPYRSIINPGDFVDVWKNSKTLIGGSHWTRKCEKYMCDAFDFHNVVFTSSCTDALEIAFALANIGPNDNVIVPGFTFVSSVLPAINYTSDITFCDVNPCTGSAELQDLAKCIKPNTSVIVAVNYGGINGELQKIRELCQAHKIFLIEDAAQSIGAGIQNDWYGSYGDVSTFSFHDTKNINSGGEGGCLVINNKEYIERAHFLSEKGTNRRDFINGTINKYEWIDKGSSHIMSDLNAFVLYHNLLDERKITSHRASLFNRYIRNLSHLNIIVGPKIHNDISPNGHLFYLLLPNRKARADFMDFMLSSGVQTVTHYLNLAKSPYARRHFSNYDLPNSDVLEEGLCRLPLHYNMNVRDVDEICQLVVDWFSE